MRLSRLKKNNIRLNNLNKNSNLAKLVVKN